MSELPSGEWRRTEQRLPIDLGSTPFLGSRESGQPTFAYLLRDVSPSGVGMIVPPRQGMVPLEVGEWINFHLPFQLNKKYYNQGVVRWQQNVPKGQMCGAHLERRVPLKYPIYVGFETGQVHFILEGFGIQSLEALTERILEDAYYILREVWPSTSNTWRRISSGTVYRCSIRASTWMKAWFLVFERRSRNTFRRSKNYWR